MTYQARLTKITSNHNNLRTNSMVGEISDIPKIGFPFIISNQDPLNKNIGANGRLIFTTNVVSVDKKTDIEYEFKTVNSTYKLEIIGEVNDNSH